MNGRFSSPKQFRGANCSVDQMGKSSSEAPHIRGPKISSTSQVTRIAACGKCRGTWRAQRARHIA